MDFMKYIHKLSRATPKKRDTTIPQTHKSVVSNAAERGRAGGGPGRGEQRLNTYSPTSATGLLTGDDGEGGHS